MRMRYIRNLIFDMRYILLVVLIAASFVLSAQQSSKFNVYKPEEDAAVAIQKAVTKASQENKHVFIQIGGNWCIWCAKFYAFTKGDAQIDSLMKSSFVVYHLNYSKENKNLAMLKKYSFPQRFGFPVFLILDSKGNLLHTQNSAYLEEDKGYSKQKVMDFFSAWTKEALNPKNYE